MQRTLTILGTTLAMTASLATTAPPSSAEDPVSGLVPISPQIALLGASNECPPDITLQWSAAANPPIFVSNCPGLDEIPNIDGMAYLAALVEIANKQGANTVTCTYSVNNWINGSASGNARWTGSNLFDAYVEGSDTALGVSFDTKTSSARAEVGMYLQSSPNWPTPSTATVDFRWAGIAYLQADADLSVLAGTGASSASAAYQIDGELWAASAVARQHYYTRTVTANGTRPSSSAWPRVRWDDKQNAVAPTMSVGMQPNMTFTSKLIGSMVDTANPVPGANASAGVDSWSKGDTYMTGSQHWTFTLPKGYTLRDCGDGSPPTG